MTESQPDDCRPLTRTGRFFQSVWAPIVIFCALSLILKENYPFSHYPMYSGISETSYYFYFTDENGEVMPTRENFGKSVSGVKKMHGAHLREIADAKNTRPYKLGWDDQVRAAKTLLEQLRERGEKRGHYRRNRPETIRLMRVDISRESTGIVKKERFVAEIPSVP